MDVSKGSMKQITQIKYLWDTKMQACHYYNDESHS